MKFPGLTDEQVQKSRSTNGTNVLTDIPPEPLWRKMLGGFREPMLVILLVALAVQLILFFLHKVEWYEPLGIFVALVLANGVASVFEHQQEGKAMALKHLANARDLAKVIRNSVLSEIHCDDIVVGDIVFLQAGDRIPADGVLVDGEIKVDQASLNGESKEASKHARHSGENFEARDLLCPYSVYRGTVVCSGEACLEVAEVGDKTIFGQAAMETQVRSRETPLQVKLSRLSVHISRFGYVGACAIVSMVIMMTVLTGSAPEDLSGWLRLLIDAVTVAVTIIVCAVPEGLPMLSSILQAIQSLKMVKDNVLVRKINGLETAGSLSILFCDKTGTITEGKLSVAEWVTGEMTAFDSLHGVPDSLMQDVIGGIGYNNSSIASGGNVIGGNGTDRALMGFLVKNGVASRVDHDKVIAFRAFDSVKKMSSVVLGRDDSCGQIVYWKGAPEKLLPRCTRYVASDGREKRLDGNAALADYLDMQASRSMRLLAVTRSLSEDDQAEMTLVGIFSIRDNVRSEAGQAIREIRQAGIQVVMVTGDRRETACAIAREAGLLSEASDCVLTSFEMAEKSDEELKAILPFLRVVARALPTDKSRLVRLAQEADYVVGMTGDGVNDAPALGRADVGFAMGSGTEVAKEAGEITILDDNLASIEKAILYGRTMYISIRRFLIFQLTVNVSAVLICSIAPLFGVNIMITVIQLLLVNLAMDTLAAIAFGGEPPLQEYMRAKPVPRSENIVSRAMMAQVLICAFYITALCLAVRFVPCVRSFVEGKYTGIVSGSTAVVFAMFMMAITFNGFNARTSHLNPFERIGRSRAFMSVMGAVFILQFVFVTFGGERLDVRALPAGVWMKCMLLALMVIPVDMLRKLAARRFAGKSR